MRLIEGKVMSESQIQTVSTEFAGRAVHSVSTEIAGRTLTIETGRYAEHADGAVADRERHTDERHLLPRCRALAPREPL
jgi:hypothetical protein